MLHRRTEGDFGALSVIDTRTDATSRPVSTPSGEDRDRVAVGLGESTLLKSFDVERGSGRRTWRETIGSTRAGLVAAYLVLLIGTGLVTTFGIGRTMRVRLDNDISAAMRQEIGEIDLHSPKRDEIRIPGCRSPRSAACSTCSWIGTFLASRKPSSPSSASKSTAIGSGAIPSASFPATRSRSSDPLSGSPPGGLRARRPIRHD